MSQKNIAKKAHARHYSHQKSHGSIAHSPTAHPITHKKKLHVIFKQTEVFAWWAKRYYECDKNFMKISHDENEKNLKIHDLTQYETFWLGKLRDKYAFQLKLKKDVECDVKQIILAGESDEQHSYALYKFFESATQAAVPTLSSQPSILTESISRGQSEAQEELPNAPSQVKEAPVRSQTEMLPEIPEGTRKRSISVGGKRKELEPKASDTEECADKGNLSQRLDSSIGLNEDTLGINVPGKDNKDNITNLLGSPTLVDRLEERIARPSITPIRVIPPRPIEFSVPNDAPEWVEDVWDKCVKNNKMWKNMGEQKIDPEQWNLAHENGKFKIWQSSSKTDEFRCLYPVESGTSAEKLLQVLLDVPNKNKWDNACDKADILIYMPTCVIHQVNKPFARHSFPREFIYARYVCKTLGTYFIIDQSLDYTQIQKSANTPRGNIDYSIMHISTEGGQVYLNMLISVTNGGLANSTQDTQITLDSLANIPHMSKVFDQYEEWDDFELAFMPGSELASRRESVAMNMRKSVYRAVRLEPEDPIIQENVQETMQESIITQNAEVVEIQNLMDCSNIVVPERGSIINREGESKLEEELIAMMSSSPKRDLSPAFGDDLLTLLEQVRTQIPASQCVDSKIQTRPLNQQEASAVLELADNTVFNGKICKRDPENGLHFINKEFLSKQISSESLLQRVSSSFCYGPQLLTLAGQQTNPLEAFKYAIAFYFSTLHTAIAQSKPFNPILGETYQGYLGGIPILCEQISCQPPISAIYMKTPDFFLYGSQQLDTSSGPNSATTTNKRRLCVTLEKLNMNIYAYFPMAIVSGTTFGNRYLNWAKRLKVYDITNNLYCELLFNPDDEKGVISGLFSKKTADADGARGSIYKVKPEFIKALHKKEEANSSSRARFDPKEHALEEIVAVEGSWISYLEIGGNRIWDGQKMKPYKLIDQPNKTLASDANYREDVIYMKIGDLIKAQEANGKLENTQRVDKKLREKSGKSKL